MIQLNHRSRSRPGGKVRQIWVAAQPGRPDRGIAAAGPLRLVVALGRSGIRADKREGDGATPRGSFRPVRVWWRADRGPRPRTGLPVRRIDPADAWCEDPADRRYNRPFRRRCGEAGDRLWRDDRLYDLIIELDHNTRPRVAGRGSAVFVHLARETFGPTAGCVGFDPAALRRLVALIGPDTRIVIGR
ncbi:L,D-transpeptidase family protein [Rhodoplanes serenus]|uniref:L,D-transpeptidase family protein n=1 Tax=Rhodoplanes serenus TaxID=200615 RepID=A0A9X4XPS3_9BRAD|nr:L,D-transpeptidase family protein [Rhodoplanes serenus]